MKISRTEKSTTNDVTVHCQIIMYTTANQVSVCCTILEKNEANAFRKIDPSLQLYNKM